MKFSFSKPKIKKRIKVRRKQLSEIGESANKNIDRHIFRRWNNLKYARRFISGWIFLAALLIIGVAFQVAALGKHYLEPGPVAGGAFVEGIEGNFSNGNPLYAVTAVDAAVAKLAYSSLLTYDTNGKLVGDLAESWQMGPNGQVYTVKLRPNLRWHDNKKLTADDVVFTYQTIQNPDSKSPLHSGWKGVKIEKVDEKTIKFTLPSPYIPFPNLLINGIVPKHLLGAKSAESLRGDSYNTKSLVGSGPFRLVTVRNTTDSTQEIQLTANDSYHRGKPSLEAFSIKTYSSAENLEEAVVKNHLTAAAGLEKKDSDIKSRDNYSLIQNSATMLFLKNSSPNLADAKVRQALTRATQAHKLSEEVGYNAVPVREPILSNQVGYNNDYWQLSYNKAEADKLLNEAGWVKPKGKQYRQKNGKDLTLKLVSENNKVYPAIATKLQKQWADVGVKLDVSFVTPDQITQTYIPNHEYDVFLYGINIGPDPDVYAYWHSSQIASNTPRLNLSEYKSTVSDIALEAGRSRSNLELRAAKYKPFLAAWKNDAPAIGLYQPRYLYMASQPVHNIGTASINNPEDRFNNVHNWMIDTAKVQKN